MPHPKPIRCATPSRCRPTLGATVTCLALAWLWCPAALYAGPASYTPRDEAGAYGVEILRFDWVDVTRDNRSVPVKLYLPEGAEEPRPVIVLSHGLGGTREGYSFLGTFWASHGYVSVHLQHVGSDDAVWREVPVAERLDAMARAAENGRAALHRPLDVRFAIDTLERLNREADSPLHGRLDLDRLGMAGHSFGAWTTLAVGGQTFITPRRGPVQLNDPRVRAMIPMSSPAPRDPANYARAFASIEIPALHMTGTLDTSVIRDTTVEERRVAFDHSPGPADGGADQYLVTFEDGDHMIFSGRASRAMRRGDPDDDPAFHRLIRQATLAFWQAYLQDDDDARRWLQAHGGLRASLGDRGRLETKP